MRSTRPKGVSEVAHPGHHPRPANPMNAHGGVAARPRNFSLRRRLLALRAGVLAALRALRATNPKR